MRTQKQQYCKLGLTTLFIISGTITNPSAFAQLTPDNTLVTESSIVNQIDLSKDRIEGGATRESNLFHSFREFNVDAGKSVYFANPTGIENILTRVTGGNVSNILGKLGVEGTANLFLINPNGIFFGKDAVLDIRGSFTATTADEIRLGEDGLFSASNPQNSNLLTVQPGALFTTALRNQQAEIKNEGNLTVDKDLTLNADNIHLSSKLQTGNNINLQANNTLKIRDSFTQPFIALAGKNLLIQGNELVDIFALNNSNSGLFSGGDMVLRSANTVDGDAHYYAGGNFRVEKLDGSLGTLSSPNDPVIKVNGDVYIEGYQGSSLHIWATGKVQIPLVIWITGVDVNNGLVDTVILSDGNSVDINGKIEPTLDIRAGVTLDGLGIPTIIPNGGNFFPPVSFPSTASSADIQIGTILFSNTVGNTILPGKVLLTNQYQPNSLLTGNITVTNSLGGAIIMGGNTGSRSVMVDSKGSINLNGNISISSPNGNGGNITLLANDNISIGTVIANGGVNGSSGNITLASKNGDINLTNVNIVSSNYGVLKGGNINVTGRSLFLNNSSISTFTLGKGNAGNIKITTQDATKFDNKSFAQSIVDTKGTATAGNVEIFTKSLELLNGSYLVASTLGEGNAGNVKITASDTVKFDNESSAESAVGKGAKGKAGNVEISTKSLELLGGSFVTANTSGTGNAGIVKITATDTVKLDSKSSVLSQVNTGAKGTAGGIEITAKSLELLGGSFLDASTSGTGDAGIVKITTTDTVKLDNKSSASSQVNTGAVGNAGGVDISTKSLQLLGDSFLAVSTFSKGDAGSLKITATDVIKFDGHSYAASQIVTEAVGNAGGIEISTKSLELLNDSIITTSTFGKGNAGIVKITATDFIKFDNQSNAQSLVVPGAIGNAGGVDISAKSLELLGGSYLSANTNGQGNAGSIKMTVRDSIKFDGKSSAASQVNTGAVGNAGGVEISTKSLELLGGSLLTANTKSKGNAGIVKITATDFIKFDGESSTQSQVASGGVGNAGGVEIFTKSLEVLGSSFIDASTFSTGNAGNVKITATDSVKFDGESDASSVVTSKAIGNAGGIEISTQSLELLDGSILSARTRGKGNAGSVTITANQVNVTNNSTIESNTSNIGNAGDILVNTSILNLTDGGQITAFTEGNGNGGTVTINSFNSVNIGEGVQNFAPVISVETNAAGKAGDIIINTPNFTLSETARITATATETATNQDGGGSITLNASKMNLAGIVGIFAETQGDAPAGTLQLNPYQNQPDLDITLFPNSTISASTSASGKGGDLIITAPENINISGQGKLAVESKGTGDAGNISITTKNLNITDGVKISASTSATGNGGNINLTSNTFTANNSAQFLTTTSDTGKAGNMNLIVRDNIILDGTNTGLFANTEKGSTGDSGNITIDPQIFIIKNGAGIGVNSQGTGTGGNISIQAGTLNLDNQAFINAATASSQGGEITLNINDLLFMRHNSNITATAGTDQAGGNGGNININSPFIVAVPYENNDITANAYQGNGGNININTNQIFGLQYRSRLTPLSDITASSDFGVNGNVIITTPGVDPTSGLTNLPTSLLDVESLNKDVCAIKDDKIAGGSSFFITGKGGLPLDSHELISNSPAFVEWEKISPSITQVPNSPVKVSLRRVNYHQEIQQAQGWIIGKDGKVILTADSQQVTLQTDKNNLPDCKS